MKYVLTLIGKPLTAHLINKVRDALEGVESTDQLGENACDILLTAKIDKTRLSKLLNQEKIDFALQPAPNHPAARRKKLLAADMDSTIIKEETLDALAAHHGCERAVAEITHRAMEGQLDFAQALTQRVALLAGLPEAALDEILAADIHIRENTQTLTATMRAHGAECLLLSGGFEKFVRPIAEKAGFIHGDCNLFEIKNGALTGRLVLPIRDAQTKKTEMLKQAQKMNISKDDIIAVGDGANDRPMIEAAGLGVAFHAKPILNEAANVHIHHSDLTALLYMQGYRQEDFF